jgi:hypothetical protein
MKTTEKIKDFIKNSFIKMKNKIYNFINIKFLLFISIALNILLFLYIIDILSVIKCYHELFLKLIK